MAFNFLNCICFYKIIVFILMIDKTTLSDIIFKIEVKRDRKWKIKKDIKKIT